MRRTISLLALGGLLVGGAPAIAAVAPAAPLRAPTVAPELAGALSDVGSGGLVRVFAHAATAGSAADAAQAVGLDVEHSFDRVGAVSAVGTVAEVQRLAATPSKLTYLEPDLQLAFDSNTSHTATRLDQAVAEFAAPSGGTLDGTGVGIAVIDSGIDGTHPMFVEDGVSKVRRNLRMLCHDVLCSPTRPTPDHDDDPLFVDLADTTNDTDSPGAGGHGTHVASIAAGYARTMADGRQVSGAAPGATLYGLGSGAGVSIMSSAASLEWVLDNHADPCRGVAAPAGPCPSIQVVNLSISAGGSYNPESLTAKLNHALIAEGVTVVWSAGNNGGDGTNGTVNGHKQSPVPGLITAANYDDFDGGSRHGGLDDTSSRGKLGDPTTYPDLAAPGSYITAACRPTLPVCQTGPEPSDPNYGTISGTSMAAPYVAGTVALLNQAVPGITPAAVEDALEDTAHKLGYGGAYEPDDPARNDDDTTSFDKGHGLIDVAAAVADVLGSTAPAPAFCSTNPVISDPAGDADRAILETPLPSEPGFDVLDVEATWDAAGEALELTVHVADLAPLVATGSTGEYVEILFSHGTTNYRGLALRSAGAEPVFRLNRNTQSALRERVVDGLSGSFDPVADTVTLRISNADLSRSLVGPVQPFAAGDVIGGFGVDMRRELGRIVPDADLARSSCEVTLS